MEHSQDPSHHPDPKQDLGNYRVVWNPEELGVRAHMRQSGCPQPPAKTAVKRRTPSYKKSKMEHSQAPSTPTLNKIWAITVLSGTQKNWACELACDRVGAPNHPPRPLLSAAHLRTKSLRWNIHKPPVTTPTLNKIWAITVLSGTQKNWACELACEKVTKHPSPTCAAPPFMPICRMGPSPQPMNKGL
ncbi:hypothetical protein DFS34DRAFT_389391 [Phlyctochytrium arcticum]|nr:hypothetical protein DFS34DRAFT_389391 [Phlyctochytrium arcticum]